MSANHRLVKAAKKEPVDCTPIWLMRQAGRYMKEYREIRKRASFLTLCKTPELAVEISLQPVRKFDLDGSIIFSDILIPVEAMGVSLDIVEGKGPLIENPVRDRSGVQALSVDGIEEKTAFVSEAIKLLVGELQGRIPVIGFSGAPFTLASYVVEGGHSRNYVYTKSLMFNQPQIYDELMSKIAEMVGRYLNIQIEAGAELVQIFDTWIGCLAPGDYEKFVMPYTRRAIELIKDKNIPVIHYGNGSAALLELMKQAGGDVIGIDWRIDLDIAWQRLGEDVGVQGNLDPVALFASSEEIERRVKNILRQAASRPGHIFNLGHGILPQTPEENVAVLVEAVHKYSRK